ncbi:carbon-nitrogen hydrolase family protein [Roseococcus suduntuyensis]|uniref:CN hydrolase domain-containing protein n=1 Tax=Roseococcus suduntuyensis TaxID=455361 RepID=A0A840ABW3_9PROT|nr:hypothetical protein [Roseococcus suduntuyensis]MBB3898382.1 hypothetical protein [Roseococcus suduntuyensis]
MPRLALGLLKVSKHNFPADPAGRMDEFALTVSQADTLLRAKFGGAPDLRMLVAPEYFWSGYGVIGRTVPVLGPIAMDRDDKHRIYGGLKKISKRAGSLVLVAGSIFYHKPGQTRALAYNVCPVLRRGSFLLKQYKEFDDGAAGKNAGRFGYDVKDSDPFFEVDGVGVGLEICGEHGRLATWNANANRTVDLQILISDGSRFLPANMVVRNGGFAIHTDMNGNSVSAGVYPAGGPYTTAHALPPDGISGAQVNGGMVMTYSLTI